MYPNANIQCQALFTKSHQMGSNNTSDPGDNYRSILSEVLIQLLIYALNEVLIHLLIYGSNNTRWRKFVNKAWHWIFAFGYI